MTNTFLQDKIAEWLFEISSNLQILTVNSTFYLVFTFKNREYRVRL